MTRLVDSISIVFNRARAPVARGDRSHKMARALVSSLTALHAVCPSVHLYVCRVRSSKYQERLDDMYHRNAVYTLTGNHLAVKIEPSACSTRRHGIRPTADLDVM